MAPLGIGLIGLGRHGMRYVRHLSDPSPDARLVAVCRRDAGQGRAVASRHGVKFFQDYGDLIACPQVDAVIVVTPPSLCLPVCLAAVRAGKPLLIEKPLACTGADARTMVRAAETAGVPLMTAHTLRFDRAVLALKLQLAAVGARRYLVLTNRVEPRPEVLRDPEDYGGRGVLLEIGIHLLDLIRYLTGEEAVEAAGEMLQRHTTRVEDLAQVRFRLASGLPCYVEVSRVSGGRVCRAEAVGQGGQLLADVERSLLTRTEGRTSVSVEPVPDRPTVVMVLEAFARSLLTGAPVPVSGEDGLRAVVMADACYRAAREGRPVPVILTA